MVMTLLGILTADFLQNLAIEALLLELKLNVPRLLSLLIPSSTPAF